MAIAVVQSQTGVTAGSGTTLTITLANPTTAGNCLVVCVGTASAVAGVHGVSGITLGGSAGNFASAVAKDASAKACAEIWTDQNCAGGQTAVVITLSVSVNTGLLFADVYEVSGLLASGALDQVSSDSGTTGLSWTSLATATTTQANEIVFGVVAQIGGAGMALTGPSSPWVNAALGSGNTAGISGYDIISATGAQTFNGTTSTGTSSSWACVAATLKSAVATPVTDADTGSGLDAQGLLPQASDTGSGLDAATVPAATLSDTDTGSGAAAGVYSYTFITADTGTGSEAQNVAPQAADTGSGLDAGSPFVSIISADTGSGADAFLSTAAHLPDTDTGSGLDAFLSIVATLPDTDTGSGADAGTPNTGGKTDTDTGSFAEASVITAVIPDSDTGIGIDLGNMNPVTDTETGHFADAGKITAAIFSVDFGTGTDSQVNPPPVLKTGADEGTFEENTAGEGVILSDSDSGAFADASGVVNSTTSRTGLPSAIGYAIVPPRQRVSVVGSSAWNVSSLTISATSPAITWNTLQRPASLVSSLFNVRIRITSATTSGFEDRKLIRAQAACSWNEQERYSVTARNLFRTFEAVVSSSPAMEFADLFRKSKSAEVTYNIPQRIQSIANIGWNTGGHDSATASFAWNVKTGGISTVAFLAWNTLSYGDVVSTAQLGWATSLRTSRDPRFAWNTRKSIVSSSNASKWNTRAHVAKSASLTWDDYARAVKTGTCRWVTRARPLSSARCTWQAIKRVNNSGAVKVSTWDVRNPVTSSSHACEWNIIQRIDQLHSCKWNTIQRRNGSIDAVLWNDRARASRLPHWVIAWNTLGLTVTSDSELMKWNVRSRRLKPAACYWNMRAATYSSGSCAWNTRKACTRAAQACSWNTTGRAYQVQECTWDEIKTYPVIALAQWNTLHDPHSTATMEWDVGMPVSLGERRMAGVSWQSAE